MPDDELTPAHEPRARRSAPATEPPKTRYRALRRLLCRGEKFEPGQELPDWVIDASPSLVAKRLGQDIEEV